MYSNIADVCISETPSPLESANVAKFGPPSPLKKADVLFGWLCPKSAILDGAKMTTGVNNFETLQLLFFMINTGQFNRF